MAHLLISAAHKSSGKTTLSIGLCRALANLGLRVQPFKKGPDYIDPMWLGRAAGHACHNLDFYTMGNQEIMDNFGTLNEKVDISIIEGNKGLYDGLDLDGSNSNAALAKRLNAPVILVIDARGMTRGIAPLILGYQAFDQDIHIAGVILNQLGGSRHESKLRAVIEHYTELEVLGAVHKNSELELQERHLGLIPSNEEHKADTKIERIAKGIAEQVDIPRLQSIAGAAESPAYNKIESQHKRSEKLRIGIAKDAAFGFYYPDDFTALQHQGAELVFIDTLKDQQLPQVDALFIGGGFPEMHMQTLSDNVSLRHQINQAIKNGLPVYAECGGLMYLCRNIDWKGSHYPMVGIIPADVIVEDRPQGRGYVRLTETKQHPWPPIGSEAENIMAHEFHYSRLINIDTELQYAYEVKRGYGIDGDHDGLIYANVLACFSHLRHTRSNPWTHRFLQFVSQCKN